MFWKIIKSIWLISIVILGSIIAIPVICIIYGLYLAVIWISYLIWFILITIAAIWIFIYYLINGNVSKRKTNNKL